MGKSNKYFNYIIIANDFLVNSEYEQALKVFKKAYNFAINNKQKVDVLFEIADIYLIFEKYTLARDKFLEIIDIDKFQSGAYYGLALVNDFLNGDIYDSIKYYKLAIEYDSEYDRAYYYLAISYDKLGEKNEALKYFFKCIELDDMDYISYNDIGSVYEELKEYELAKFYLEKSLKVNPNYFRALFNMGVVSARLKDNKKALNYYKKALEESTSSNIYLNISALYIEDKNYEDAINILNEGIYYNPESVNLYYNRACSKKNLGFKDEAILDLKKAIDIDEEVINWAKKDSDLCDIGKEYKIW